VAHAVIALDALVHRALRGDIAPARVRAELFERDVGVSIDLATKATMNRVARHGEQPRARRALVAKARGVLPQCGEQLLYGVLCEGAVVRERLGEAQERGRMTIEQEAQRRWVSLSDARDEGHVVVGVLSFAFMGHVTRASPRSSGPILHARVDRTER